MKFKRIKEFFHRIFTPETVFFGFLVLLLIPNILLSYTENLKPVAVAANILAPLGVYAFLMTLSKNLGRSMWIFLPIVLLAITQIVLLTLYGRSVIAVDMFLNITTTNGEESGELFGSIFPIIVLVAMLYLPSLIVGVWMWKKNIHLPSMFRRYMRIISMIVALNGIACGFIAGATDHAYSMRNDLYPVNAAYNMTLAAKHSYRIADHEDAVRDFRFDAVCHRPDSLKELYVIVIGETSRADNWQVCGYTRETNPLLSKRTDLLAFRKALSESNTTHKSVPLLLSHLTAENYGDSIYNVRSIITAFKEAGYSTAFISNQTPNNSFIQFFGEEADDIDYICQHGSHCDTDLLPHLDKLLEKGNRRQLVIIHGYGSHFSYRDRYPRSEAHFVPDTYKEMGVQWKAEMINAYDNSILVTDRLLAGVIERLENAGADLSAMIFTADHGEDLYDDGRGLLLHSSPCPTFYQLHVPFLVWLSPGFADEPTGIRKNLTANINSGLSSSLSLFDTAMDIAAITTARSPLRWSLARPDYSAPSRCYLNDHNHSVTLRQSGFIEIDFRHLDDMESGKSR